MTEYPKRVYVLLDLCWGHFALHGYGILVAEIPAHLLDALAVCQGTDPPLILVRAVGTWEAPARAYLTREGKAVRALRKMEDHEGNKGNEESDQKAASGMSWQEVAKRLEELRKQGEPFTSQRKLAKDLGCSASWVNKAIKETPALHGWAKRQAAPKAQSLNEVVTDRTAESREPNPED